MPHAVSPDESTVRRWCWDTALQLREQDDDLLLMDATFAPWLLEEAAAGCPRRDDALAIVMHGVRDRAHAAVGRDYRDEVQRASALAPLARAARAAELADYLARLERYARPGRVDEDEARSRAHDLARCAPPPSMELERAGAVWRARTGGDAVLEIDASTGAMRRV